MTPKAIMDAAKELHDSVDSTYSIGAARKAAKQACSLVFYLAKLHLEPEEAKAIKGLPKPRRKPR